MQIKITLIEPTAYGRLPLWKAEYPTWPAIDPVQFRANDMGDANLMRIAREKLQDSKRECSVD